VFSQAAGAELGSTPARKATGSSTAGAACTAKQASLL